MAGGKPGTEVGEVIAVSEAVPLKLPTVGDVDRLPVVASVVGLDVPLVVGEELSEDRLWLEPVGDD